MLLLNPLPQRLDSGATPTFAGLLAGDGTAAAPSISFAAATNMGFYRVGPSDLGVSVGGAYSFIFGGGGTLYGANGTARLTMPAAGSIGLVAAGSAQNITLSPSTTGFVDVSGTGGLRVTTPNSSLWLYNDGGTQAVGLRLVNATLRVDGGNIYPTGGIQLYTAANSGLQIAGNGRVLLGTLTDSGALLQVGANGANGTALAGISFGGDTFLYRSGVNGLVFNGVGTGDTGFNIAKAGTIGLGILYDGANAYLTATAGMLLRTNGGNTALTLGADLNATFAGAISGTNITASTGAYYAWTAKSRIKSPSDGIVTLLNAAETDFSRLQFGGTTASFPAIARNGATVQVVLADSSNFASLDAANFTANSAAATVIAGKISYGSTTATTVGAAGGASLLPATPLGYIIVNVAGTAAKIPYYNS